MPPDLTGQIQAELLHLSPDGQRKVLEFVRSMNASRERAALPPGTPVSELLKLGGLIPPEDLAEMQRAIDEDCEKVDWDEW